MITLHPHTSRSPAIPVLRALPARAKFSRELRSLAEQFADRPARLSEILAATQGRGFNLLLLVIGLPFLTPIPLSNGLPALTVVLLAAGAMERDGIFFVAGRAVFGATLAFFGLLAFGGAHLLDNLRHTIFGS